MNINVVHVGRDVEDGGYHGPSLDRATGGTDRSALSGLTGLMGHLRNLDKHFGAVE